MTKTRNFRYSWPHNNIFNRAQHENELLQSILSQPVEEASPETPFEGNCEDLKPILKRFLERHQRTNYKLILRKSQNKVSSFRLYVQYFVSNVHYNDKLL